jgi:hypothetical protein
MNIPQTGVNAQKSKFFKEIASAFEFLALFHSLSADDQLNLMNEILILKAKAA